MMASIPVDLSNESQQGRLYGATISTFALATLNVILRFVSRKLVKADIWADDHLIVAALVFAAGTQAVFLYAVSLGMGKHYGFKTVEVVAHFHKAFLASEVLGALSINCVKCSIMALYWRLFQRRRYIRSSIYVIGVCTTAIAFATVVVALLQCRPLREFWVLGGERRCIDTRKYLMWSCVPGIVIDFMLLVLPLPAIWSLNSTRLTRFALTATFLLGGFVCIASTMRLVTLVDVDFDDPDLTWSISSMTSWTMLEINVAVISACLSSFRPLLGWLTTRVLRVGRPASKAAAWRSIPNVTETDTKKPQLDRVPRSRYSESGSFRAPVCTFEPNSHELGFLGIHTTIGFDQSQETQTDTGIRVLREITVE